MSKKFDFEEFSKELANQIRQGRPLTGEDGAFTPLIKKVIEAALEGEMDQHLKETKKTTQNRRNGRGRKNLKSSLGGIEIFSPRDRDGSFEPQTIAKRQRILPGDLDTKILALYSHGMSYSDIRSHIEEMYGVDVSDGTITSITDRIIPEIREWQNRPLERLYPIVYMDAIYFKVRDEGRVRSKAIYTILAINIHGCKEVLGLYLGENKSASFWMSVLTDLKARGVLDILITATDNLKGFTEAIRSVFPQSTKQICIVHQIRNSCRFVPWKDRKPFTADMRMIYSAPNREAAALALDQLEEKWGNKYQYAIKSWRDNWSELTAFLDFPLEIRRIVYTTNTIENLNGKIRKYTKNKLSYQTDETVLKSVFLAV